MAEETPAKDLIEVYSESAAELDTELDKPTFESVAETSFICASGEWMRFACAGEPFYEEHEGKHYCVLHYPGKEKATDFKKAFERKIAAEDFNFCGVWFPDDLDFVSFGVHTEANFSHVIFSAKANFFNATFSARADFNGAIFTQRVYFFHTLFEAEADLHNATFNAQADFSLAKFKARTDFQDATFSARAKFDRATFGAQVNFRFTTFGAQADFRDAVFCSDVHFSYATFKDEIKFSGKESFGIQSSLDLQFARIEKTERVSFHTVTLRPHWFVNVDPRKFVFIDVSWPWGAISIEGEIESLTKKEISAPHRLLAITCRQLAENAETNNRYEEASRFRYWAMDLARQYKWQGKAFLKTDWLHMLYWAVSGYGERILRAFAWILAIWIIFALLYTKVGFTKPDGGDEPLPFKSAFTYSLSVMSLQKPEPRPLTNTAQTLVLLETILGPVQAALLALAIRRKFMR